MKSASIVISSILCAAYPAQAQNAPKPQTKQNLLSFHLGTESISKIRIAYESGKYNAFLQEMDDSYEKIRSEGLLASFADCRSPIPPGIDWEDLAVQLIQKMNREFLKEIPFYDHSLLAEKVRIAAVVRLTPEEENAWLHLEQFHRMAPKTGNNRDENSLIDLDLEYEYKMSCLDRPLEEGQSPEDRREKQHVLRMQKMDRLVQASQSFKDESIKKSVQLAEQSLDAKLAQSWDLEDLNALVKEEEKSRPEQEDAPEHLMTESPPPLLSGTEYIAMIRAAYEGGEFNSFLQEIDAFYQNIRSQGRLSSIAAIRSSISPAIDWENLASQLHKNKNRELLKAIPCDDHSLYAEKVRNAATDTLSPEEENAWAQIERFHHMAPATGNNCDENNLIDLDLEYEYKITHLDRFLMEEKFAADRREKQQVLRMQKMERMVQASQSFEDASMKQSVQLAANCLDSQLAQSWDLEDLNIVAKRNEKLGTEQEEKVASILSYYQGKFNDLSRQFIETEGVKTKIRATLIRFFELSSQWPR